MREVVYISLGSNLGDRRQNITDALTELGKAINVHLQISALYETEPWQFKDQPSFINCVAGFELSLNKDIFSASERGHLEAFKEGNEPLALLKLLQDIEISGGRIRNEERWGPRTIDVDILMYGTRQLNSDELVLPHPEMLNRRFVLEPLAEIAPHTEVPGSGITVTEALQKCVDACQVKMAPL